MIMQVDPEKIMEELQTLPNVGPKFARDLYDAGIRSLSDFRSIDPEILYDRINAKYNFSLNERILYMLRAIVYWVNTEEPDTNKKHWWAWQEVDHVEEPEFEIKSIESTITTEFDMLEACEKADLEKPLSELIKRPKKKDDEIEAILEEEYEDEEGGT